MTLKERRTIEREAVAWCRRRVFVKNYRPGPGDYVITWTTKDEQ